MGLRGGNGLRRIFILLCLGAGLLIGLDLATTTDPGSREAVVVAAAEHTPDEAAGHRDLGQMLPLWSCLPFAGMLLSIAFLPLIAPRFWHHHFGKIAAFWAAALGLPFLIVFKGTALHEILHIMLADYVPFIILLWSLYTVSGGILLRGTLGGTPGFNTLLLLAGTLMASWMGTTGAAMLLIRPLLNANRHRKKRTFMVVFFIFLVANIGGALTPLGDPPLFLGYLHGVPFFWTFKVLPHTLIMAVSLLSAYFLLDTYHYRREGIANRRSAGSAVPIKLEGLPNVFILGGVVLAVLMSGILDWGAISVFGVHRTIQDWARDMVLVALGIVSLKVTPAQLREDNNFSWFSHCRSGLFVHRYFRDHDPLPPYPKGGPPRCAGLAGQWGPSAEALFLGSRRAFGFPRQCAHLSHFFQHGPGKLLSRNGRSPGGAAAHHGERRLPESDFLRSGVFRSLQLYRQCTQFYGTLHCRGAGHPHAEFFRLYL